MSGTVIGGKRAAITNKKRHGESFYANIGRLGGKKSKNGGFASPNTHICHIVTGEHKIAVCAGTIGGQISRRVKNV